VTVARKIKLLVPTKEEGVTTNKVKVFTKYIGGNIK
jgi:hypothetical protein